MVTVAAGCAMAAAGTAVAAPPPTKAPESALLLSVRQGEHPRPNSDEALLLCQPSGGSHPSAARACAQLARQHGKVAEVRLPSKRPCVLIYAPVTVTASGTWHGRPIHYTETFGNACMLHTTKGAIFRF